jgi:hypothetical protein
VIFCNIINCAAKLGKNKIPHYIFYLCEVLSMAQSGFQVAISFATPFMAWIINFTRLFAWTLVHIRVKTLVNQLAYL